MHNSTRINLLPVAIRFHLKTKRSLLTPEQNRYRALRRVFSKVNKFGPLWNGTHCWIWCGCLSDTGYGSFSFDGKGVNVHQWLYNTLVGPVPKGKELDHLCRVRGCVNPSHLEPVTRLVNCLRGSHPAILRIDATSCVRGHVYTEDSVSHYHRKDGTLVRTCLICRWEKYHLEGGKEQRHQQHVRAQARRENAQLLRTSPTQTP